MAKILGLALGLVCASHERVKYSTPARQRFRLVLPSRGERRAVGELRPVLEIVRSA